MSGDQTGKRYNGLELMNVPGKGNEGRVGHDNQPCNANDGEGHAEPEVLEHLGHLDEEVGELEFLCRCAPRHVDLEHVREDGFGDVNGDAAEEDEEHKEPLEVFAKGR